MYLLLVTDYISNRQFIFDNRPLDVNQNNFKIIFHEYVSKIQELHKGFDMYMNIVNNECEIYYFKENLTDSRNLGNPEFNNNLGQVKPKKSSFIKKIAYVLHFIPILLELLEEPRSPNLGRSSNLGSLASQNLGNTFNCINCTSSNCSVDDSSDSSDTKTNKKEQKGLSDDIKQEFITEMVERLNLPKYGLSS